jgi:hypothetical protein
MGRKTTTGRRTLNVPDFAKEVGINRCLAYRLCRDGTIPSLRLGNRVVIPVSVAEKMLADPSALVRDDAEKDDSGENPS